VKHRLDQVFAEFPMAQMVLVILPDQSPDNQLTIIETLHPSTASRGATDRPIPIRTTGRDLPASARATGLN
jgi:hypothetical protein